MKVAVIGSREIVNIDLSEFLPKETTEIVSGGAKGVDSIAKIFAFEHNLKLTEFLPEYEKYGRAAPLKRNLAIIEYADKVLAFWDGTSKGTEYVIKNCNKLGKPIEVFKLCENPSNKTCYFSFLE